MKVWLFYEVFDSGLLEKVTQNRNSTDKITENANSIVNVPKIVKNDRLFSFTLYGLMLVIVHHIFDLFYISIWSDSEKMLRSVAKLKRQCRYYNSEGHRCR
jgi:hypothetical protein